MTKNVAVPSQPLDLDEIADQPVSKPNEPDSETKAEIKDWDLAAKDAQLRGLIQDIEERKKYASRIFCLIAIWLVGIFVLLLFQGFKHVNIYNSTFDFQLSDEVLIAAIGGTTINVIGIFVVVARYLFPRRDSGSE